MAAAGLPKLSMPVYIRNQRMEPPEAQVTGNVVMQPDFY